MTKDDLPWLYDLCVRRYGPEYDPYTASSWFLNTVLTAPQQWLAIRTDRAFTIAHVTIQPFRANVTEVQQIFTCAEEGAMWEAVHLLRVSRGWAKAKGAKRWCLWSETSFDLEPLARRLGFPKESKVYVLAP